jgi:hypothetical protein
MAAAPANNPMLAARNKYLSSNMVFSLCAGVRSRRVRRAENPHQFFVALPAEFDDVTDADLLKRVLGVPVA